MPHQSFKFQCMYNIPYKNLIKIITAIINYFLIALLSLLSSVLVPAVLLCVLLLFIASSLFSCVWFLSHDFDGETAGQFWCIHYLWLFIKRVHEFHLHCCMDLIYEWLYEI